MRDPFENPEEAISRQFEATQKLIEIAEKMPHCEERDHLFKQADALLELHEEAMVNVAENTVKTVARH
jgi:hypothetical protein